MIKIAPSILSADFANLEKEILDISSAGAHYVHVDVMDGMFVPNITVGLPVVKSLRRVTDMVLDVHLMINQPHRYVEQFCDAGADIVNFHVEADSPEEISRSIELIKSKGKKAALTVKPATLASELMPYIESLDLILVMTVEPGFGGQGFMNSQLPKIQEIKETLLRVNPGCDLEVDGGINPETAALVKRAGANVLVAGNAVFAQPDRAVAISNILNA